MRLRKAPAAVAVLGMALLVVIGPGTAQAAPHANAQGSTASEVAKPAPGAGELRPALAGHVSSGWSPALVASPTTGNPKLPAGPHPRRSAHASPAAGSALTPNVAPAIHLYERPRFNTVNVPDSDGAYIQMERTATGNGYWLVSTFGAVMPFGDAGYYGDAEIPTLSFSGDIVGIAGTPSGHGYYLVSTEGDVLLFGDAENHGAAADPTGLVIGIGVTQSGHGYWVVRADGSFATFGDAGRIALNTLSTANSGPTGFVIAIRSDGANGFYLLTDLGVVYGPGSAPSNCGKDTLAELTFTDLAVQPGVGFRVLNRFGPHYWCANTPTPSHCLSDYATAAPSPAPVTLACTNDFSGFWLASITGQVTANDGAPAYGSVQGVEVAALVDDDPAPVPSQLSASVNWGDGTSGNAVILGTGLANGGPPSYFVVVAPAHTWGNRGFIPITVQANDNGDTQSVFLTDFNVVVTTEGYWLVASDGGIFPFGGAVGFGSTGGIHLNKPIVGMTTAPFGFGYWLVASDGGIFPFGNATGHGSTGSIALNQPIVGMASTPSGNGYWLVASDGGIFPFGDAVGRGSTGAIKLNKAIVGMAPSASGDGYWLVATDGGIFPFGDARGFGSTGSVKLNKPIVGMAPTPSGRGYWLVASDGGIFPFGDARGLGSTGSVTLNKPIVGMTPTPSGRGYWLVASDGGIFPFGDAIGYGSTGGIKLNQPIVGMAYNP